MKLFSTIAVVALLVGCADHSHFDSKPECSVTKESGITKLTCNGETIEVADGKDGRQGDAGINGIDGTDGVDGSDGLDGQAGQDGIDGVDGTSGLFVALHDPCGQETQFDEVLLETRDGQFLAYLAGSSTTNSRLVLLDEGINYTTTDGTNCKFKIENGVLID